jgi:carboxynorspermidine decarboxylase
VFNSFAQFNTYKHRLNKHNSIGIRVNPEISTVTTKLYDPCSANSRLGVTIDNFPNILPDQIDGLHFHALCEQGSSDLKKVLDKFEQNFSSYFSKLKWVNFGGGHLITKKDYDIPYLIQILNDFKNKYPHLTVYLEPGEAIGWETGYLVSTVLDIVNNKENIAILDTSAECHMPDTLAMPYKAQVRDAKDKDIKKYNYILAGNSCLAGDIMGTYSFDKPLKVGDKIIFEDMIHYTMVKTTTFNGINLPSIAIQKENGNVQVVKNYGYESYIDRLS